MIRPNPFASPQAQQSPRSNVGSAFGVSLSAQLLPGLFGSLLPLRLHLTNFFDRALERSIAAWDGGDL
ncbi:MAG: hypothetical protein ACK6DN_00720, partial [Planctomycetota bacterium]